MATRSRNRNRKSKSNSNEELIDYDPSLISRYQTYTILGRTGNNNFGVVASGINKEPQTGISPLKTELEYYINNRDELVEKYCGKYVVISGNKVIAAYDDENVAYEKTIKTIPLGSFMIHHVTEEEEIFTISPVLGG